MTFASWTNSRTIALECIDGGVYSAVRERAGRDCAAVEKGDEQVDRITEIDVTVVVDVAGVDAGGCRPITKEPQQDEDPVGDVDGPISVSISPDELDFTFVGDAIDIDVTAGAG